MATLVDMKGMTPEERAKYTKSCHPRVADQRALGEGWKQEKCSQCGELVWVAPGYPDVERWCGYCSLPYLTGEHRAKMLQLLGMPPDPAAPPLVH